MKLFRRTFLAAGLSATSLVALRSALASPLGLLRSRGKLAVVYSRSPEGTAFSDCVRREFGGDLGELTIALRILPSVVAISRHHSIYFTLFT